MTSLYCEGDRALAGLLREAVDLPPLEALKRVFGHGTEQLVLGLRQADFQRYFSSLKYLGISKAQSSPDLRAQSSVSVLQAAGRL